MDAVARTRGPAPQWWARIPLQAPRPQPSPQTGPQPSQQPNPRQKDPEGWSASDGPLLDQVDRILDKISAEGMGSLTDDERKILDDVSRRHRSN